MSDKGLQGIRHTSNKPGIDGRRGKPYPKSRMHDVCSTAETVSYITFSEASEHGLQIVLPAGVGYRARHIQASPIN